jgi:hypothetical protein
MISGEIAGLFGLRTGAFKQNAWPIPPKSCQHSSLAKARYFR